MLTWKMCTNGYLQTILHLKNKTEYMIIGSRQRISNLITNPKIELGESVIKGVHKLKTLRVIIDQNLSWSHQIQHIVTKASRGIGMM